ncbi:MAG: cation:dicarboxylase symporter family transporter [Lachnospiraceae bacterium]|nr:cation:dicarboxylase symporter family transporter [Lachnospiraceae bacterium]
MRKKTEYSAVYHLDDQSIDRMSEKTRELFDEMGLKTKTILRLRLSAEDVMGVWSRELGTEAECIYTSGSIMGRSYIQLKVKGKSINPNEYEDELLQDVSNGSSIMSAVGLLAEYKYESGYNILKLSEPISMTSQLLVMLASITFAVLLGMLMRRVSPQFCSSMSVLIITPVFDTLMNLLSSIAGPLIFLAVFSGICGIGDVSALGKIGKRLVSRFVIMTYISLGLALVMIIWFFPVARSSEQMGSSSFEQLLQLMLSMIPSNVVEPFSTGNALQIIFMAISIGIGALMLGNSVSELIKIIKQIDIIVQFLMIAIGKLIPFFVFISVFQLVISKDLSNLSSMLQQVVMCVAVSFVIIMLYALYISIRYKKKLFTFIKELMPTFIVALTTASSVAAFSVNTECCEKKLGMDKKFVNFGIPLGQVIYMPIGAVMFFVASLCIGQSFGVTITPLFILISIFISGVLAIATPPIPGGALSCYTILFTQLGIPAEGIVLAISIDLMMDYFITACNIACLQEEMYIDAQKLQLISKK